MRFDPAKIQPARLRPHGAGFSSPTSLILVSPHPRPPRGCQTSGAADPPHHHADMAGIRHQFVGAC